MPVVLLVLGFSLVAAGLWFAIRGTGEAAAGGQALRGIAVQGPAWLILVAIGVGVCVWGAWLGAGSDPKFVTETSVSTTASTSGFDGFDDDFVLDDVPFDYLDELWDDCAFGDMSACDELYWDSPFDSDWEWFGATCGFVFDDDTYAGECAEI
jgi:hypothetical protein